LKVTLCPDAKDAALHAAGLVADYLNAHPDPVLGLATGETMRPVYAELVRLFQLGRVRFSHATTFNLDEYAGIAPDHPASFARFMHKALFAHVDLDPRRIHLLDGQACDAAAEAQRYEAALRATGGIGLQLLGIGRNGHIAFNEPRSSFGSRTRRVVLDETTRQANAPAFDPQPVPTHALTMGIGTILEARSIVLLATGGTKTAAIKRMVRGPYGADCPATALQTHSNVAIVLDDVAAAGLAIDGTIVAQG
jgi:glucosamine-6-phosphate deaminase